VPLHGPDGRVLAAVEVAQHAGRGTARQLVNGVLPTLRAAVAAIEADLAVAFERQPLELG
jgi:IclR family transcriptional regulator, pca regulon regulatory protein